FQLKESGQMQKKMCLGSINPQKIDSDVYSIIFEPYSVGELLAFVVAANFNFKTCTEKKSCFSNNFDKQIAVEQLSLIDDPHALEGIGTKSVDDEGIETKKQSLIDKGFFKSTFSNLFDSYKESEQSSGNGLRLGSPLGKSSEPIPIAAPHNLKINPGKSSQEDMIKDTKRGLLVGRLWYTYAVNPIKGDFSCTARSGIKIIENGKIKGPGKSVRIIHNLCTMLKNITEIGNNQRNVIQWASLPSITPSLKAENISVKTI
ncbi:MAG: TldD/PmbA family protein, partial [Nitrosopumilus sp.]|nr:TldD/PmbA family protein [Nitrosopumilus sp.]